MDVKIQETIEKLKALALVGDSHENLSAICLALMDSDRLAYGWTISACSSLRDVLVGMLEQLDPDEWSSEYLDEVGLMRLPVDEDGEVIHVGDKVVYVNCDSERGDVTSIEYGSDCVTVVVDHGRAGMDYKPQELRHYHKPTFEDIVRDMLNDVVCAFDVSGGCTAWMTDTKVAEYAAKLREVMRDE